MVYVILVVLLLSFFAAGVGSQTLFALNLTERLSEQLRAAYIARSAVQLATLVLEQDDTRTTDALNESWANSPAFFQRHGLADGFFSLIAQDHPKTRYGLSDEEGRLNLNTAPPEVLARLLQTAGGMWEDDAAAAADAIADWRDEDTDERDAGAEGFYYRSLSHAYDCKDAPFENVEELLLVKGISPEGYQRIEPYVTVYGSGRLNLNTAREPVLQALLSEEGAAGFLAFRDGDDSREGTGDDRRLASVYDFESDLRGYLPDQDLVRLAKYRQDELLTVMSTTFRTSIQAETPHPAGLMRAVCVMDRKGTIRLWAER